MNRRVWKTTLEGVCAGLSPFCDNPLFAPVVQFDEPAGLDDIERIEDIVGCKMPAALREFFTTVSRRVCFTWSIKPPFGWPEKLRGVTHGNFTLDLDEVARIYQAWNPPWLNLHSATFGGECRYDYTELFPVLEIGNGDAILLVKSGPDLGHVVCFTHEGASNDPLDDVYMPTLSDSFESFLDTWITLGCPGPEIWEVAPFLDLATKRLSAETDLAKLWRSHIGST